MKRALFVVDDRPTSGLGHIVRCGALADELQSRGWSTRFLKSPGGVDEGDIFIVDVRQDFEGSIGLGNAKPIWIEDACPKLDSIARLSSIALVVNGSAGAKPEMYANSGAKRVLAGPKYALLRPEFQATGDGCWIRDGILDTRKVSERSAAEVAKAMACAKVAITPAGMRAMECACVGTPMVLVQDDPAQALNAFGLASAGAGLWWLPSDARTPDVMARSLLNHPELAEMSAAGRALVDGLGCVRVADAIEEIVR